MDGEQAINFTQIVVDALAVRAPAHATVVALPVQALADQIADADHRQADLVQGLVYDLRRLPVEEQPAAIKPAIEAFALALDAKGYKGTPVRKSELKRVLEAALKFPDWEPESGGLQACAKEARKLGKTEAHEVIEIEAPKETDFIGSIQQLIDAAAVLPESLYRDWMRDALKSALCHAKDLTESVEYAKDLTEAVED